MRGLFIAAIVLTSGEAIAVDRAEGLFQVAMEPQEETETDGARLGRFTLTKTFEGGLAGAGAGWMLTVMSETPGSAAYVAAERFEGVLDGRTGSFALTHRGVMADGEQILIIEIVPDSGAGELVGISGAMTVDIRDGGHFYVLDYEIADTQDR